MKKLVGALPLILTALLCLGAFSFSATAFLLGDAPRDTALQEVGMTPLKGYTLSTAPSSSTPTSPSSDKSSLSSSSVAVNTVPSGALGKIYEQFLSPYRAGISYNGIYLKNSTGLSVNLKEELAAGWGTKLSADSRPQVLIVHTHATESYMDSAKNYYTSADKSRNTDNSKNVTHIGEIIADILNDGGIGVLHDRTQHDHPAYNGSYSRAAQTLNEYLDKYPSIKIVVDVHRDSIAMNTSDKCKPTVTIGGKKAAQVMLVMGSQTGSVTGFPNWRENFRLAIRYQQTMEALYPGLARPLAFASRRYNENLTTGSMILEVGTDANTFEEACYSAELAGKSLLSLLNTLK
ncbi:MAG: stage II sporulation protein P [Acutalibacteraceae bacterium]|nr:stage II sporulation protein P [Acutalibacteraceae bacterium]